MFLRLKVWTTTYLGDALDALCSEGFDVSDEAAAQFDAGTTRPHQLLPHYLSTSTPNCAVKHTAHSA